MNTLGDRIKLIRKEACLNQSQLAAKLDIKQDMLSRYENNKTKTPSHIMEILHNVFQIDISWLLTGKGNMHSIEPIEDSNEPQASYNSTPSEEQEKKNITKRFIEAIEWLRETNETTKPKIAAKMGISTSLLTEISKGRNFATHNSIKKLTKTFSIINKKWIITGEGNIINSEPAKQDNTDFTQALDKTNHIIENQQNEINSLKEDITSKKEHISTLNELINAKSELIKQLKEQIEVLRGNDISNKQAV